MEEPFLIGIAGASGNGKSTICDIVRSLYPDRFLHLATDNFFKDKQDCPVHKRWMNWETPESMKFDELFRALQQLKAGQPTQVPVYAKRQAKKIGYKTITPKPNIFVEGFMLFYPQEIREALDLRIFLSASQETQLQRRLWRQPDLDLAYFNEVIVPGYQKYILPTEQYAHHTINSDRPLNAVTKEFIEILNIQKLKV